MRTHVELLKNVATALLIVTEAILVIIVIGVVISILLPLFILAEALK